MSWSFILVICQRINVIPQSSHIRLDSYNEQSFRRDLPESSLLLLAANLYVYTWETVLREVHTTA